MNLITLAKSKKSMNAAEQNPAATKSKKMPIAMPAGVPSKVCKAVARPL